MTDINDKILNISKYLQALTEKKYVSQVQEAVDKQDKNALAKICKEAEIPVFYRSSIVSIIMSVQPQKWPAPA
jgi:hypothetical protein